MLMGGGGGNEPPFAPLNTYLIPWIYKNSDYIKSVQIRLRQIEFLRIGSALWNQALIVDGYEYKI